MKTPGKKRSLLIVTFILLASCVVAIAVTVPRTIFTLNADSRVASSPLLLSQGDDGPLVAAYIRDIRAAASPSMASPLITTNKTGFLAGETLTISGSGYLPGQVVTLQVTHSDGSAESGANHEPFTATADTTGNFTANWTVGRDSAGNSFTLLADGSVAASIYRIALIGTDKVDYRPGEQVQIRGTGFNPGENVNIKVEHSNGMNNSPGNSPFNLVADSNGNVATAWFVDPADSRNAIFRILATGASSALAATTTFTDPPITLVDDQGPDDLSGQKDLNQLQIDYGLPGSTSIGLTWNWDDTAWSGSNTGDACSLIDTDGDGKANYSFCVTVHGSPATFLAYRLYSCGDSRSDRCDQPTTLISTFQSTATASVVANSDPFGVPSSPYYAASHTTGQICSDTPGCYTDDTVANVTLKLADFGNPASAKLINVCSYPSQEPNSAPSECVIKPNSGFLTIQKTTQTSASAATTFTFNSTPGAVDSTTSYSKSITGAQTDVLVTQLKSYDPTSTLSLAEVIPTGWSLSTASCVVKAATDQSTGSFSVDTISNISVQSGLETVCSFTDVQAPQLTVVKKIVGGNGTTDTFDVKVDGTTKINDAASTSSTGTSSGAFTTTVGDHTVSETFGDGTTAVSSDWTVAFSGDCDSAGKVTLAAGDSKTCTVTNTKKPKLTVTKTLAPTSDTGLFNLQIDGTTYAANVGNNGTTNAQTVSIGAHTVGETAGTGTTLSDYNAVIGGDCASDGTITLAAGDNKTCTITNSRMPQLKVKKVFAPTTDAGLVDFTVNGTAYNNGGSGYGNNGTTGFVNATLSGNSASESGHTGTNLSNYDSTWSCDNGASGSGTSITGLSLSYGDKVTCTFTNSRLPQLRLKKVFNPTTDTGLVDFTLNGTSDNNGGNGYGNSGTTAFSNATLSGNSASETGHMGTNLSDYTSAWSCDDAGSTSGTGTSITGLALSYGDKVTCTFTNTRKPKLTVNKVLLPSGDFGKFNLQIDGSTAGTGTNVGDGGTTGAVFVSIGNHTVGEAAGTGSDLINYVTAISGDCAANGSVTLAAGDNKVCTITNTRRGTIIAAKVTNPTGASGSFVFTGDASGTIGDGGQIVVSNLAPGQYTSVESDPTPGFDLTSISCDDASSTTASGGNLSTRTATFKLDPGETVKCTFTNTQRGSAKVVKTLNGSSSLGSNTFTFQLRSGASASAAGNTLESLTANSGNGGVLNFTTKLVPGTTYQLCEQMQPGWLTTLGPPLYSVFNPSGDNSVVCTDFTVTAGQTKTFNIDNQPPPGGMALTIGFWKNWASCANSNGKQKPILDQTLQKSDLTPGLLVLHDSNSDPNVASDCQAAVNLLNKTTVSGGKKMASDPIFNMVAQLVAADLNVIAGAGQSLNSMTAMSCAHTLLLTVHFNGNTYDKMNAAQTAQANCLAAALDQYNNNKTIQTCSGCP